jgi:hypothetical protein
MGMEDKSELLGYLALMVFDGRFWEMMVVRQAA